MFQGPKRRPNDLEIYEHHFLENKAWEQRKQTSGGPRAQMSGPTRPMYLAAWDPPFWPSELRCRRSFLHRLRFDLKPPIKIVPRRSLEGAPQKHRNTETEIWSCRLEGENSGGALTVWSPASPDRKSTRLNSSHSGESRMPSSA